MTASFLVGVLVGATIGSIATYVTIRSTANRPEPDDQVDDVVVPTEEIPTDKLDDEPYYKYRHLPPVYRSMYGPYRKLTVCSSCFSTAAYEDQHPAGCCGDCGGMMLNDELVGIWVPHIQRWKLSQHSPYPYPVDE